MAHNKPSINNSGPEELGLGIEGITGVEAEHIVQFRQEHGPFHNLDELREVPGITDEMVEMIKEQADL